MTPAEARLWVHLRDVNRNGANFRRQAPIGPFVVDFACLTNRIVIKVDGSGHTRDHAIRSDAQRDVALQRLGFHVLRLGNEDVLHRIEAVVDRVYALMEQQARSDLADLSSPVVGGGGSAVPETEGGFEASRNSP